MVLFFQRFMLITTITTAAYLVVYDKRAHGFVQKPSAAATAAAGAAHGGNCRRRGSLLVSPLAAKPIPGALAELDICDLDLWNLMPPGAQRDLERFCAVGKDEMAKNRVETMKDIMAFVKIPEDGMWEIGAWETGVASWEENEEAERVVAKANAKAERTAKAKAAREAAKAKEDAAAAEAAAAASTEEDFQ